eukprot:TRINITY_DN64688_c0_g1_i1.p1 TRINITY_DN64688_c0_g1~~TRINITY_DN64688_c0_g1_i1.p1  ORF type:complete len:183 (+),score=18.71 TRINITY_DN64688_c0_g1_i1:34-549(+)
MLSGSSDVPVPARVLGALCFLLPLVAAVPYGTVLFAHSRLLREVLLRPLFPLIKVFYSSRFFNLLSIVGIYGLVAKNRSMHPFSRAIGAQAATLMMMQFPANFLLQFFAPTPGPIANLARGSIFVYFLFCAAIGVFSCFEGKPRDLPGIGNGVTTPNFRRPGSMRSFRGGG